MDMTVEYTVVLDDYINDTNMILHDHLESEIESLMLDAVKEVAAEKDAFVPHFIIGIYNSPWKTYTGIYAVTSDGVTLYDLQSNWRTK